MKSGDRIISSEFWEVQKKDFLKGHFLQVFFKKFPIKKLSILLIVFNLVLWISIGLRFTTTECVWNAITGPSSEEKRAILHIVATEYQGVPTNIRVLLPKHMQEGKRYKVLYILPTVPQLWDLWWNSGLHEAVKYDVQNKYDVICVYPSLERMPWFADNPANLKIRQESYIVRYVVPFIDEHYPTLRKPEGRLLLGISKSGCGAFTLFLRYPEIFGKAVAWDAPLMYRDIKQLPESGLVDVFGTEENFNQYYLPTLLRKQAMMLREQPVRLILMGYGDLKDHVEQAHSLMEALHIPHIYDNSTHREHKWQSGWLPDAVKYLLQ